MRGRRKRMSRTRSRRLFKRTSRVKRKNRARRNPRGGYRL